MIFCLFVSSCVRVVTSERAGMGKSLYIQRMKEQLKTKCTSRLQQFCDVVIPVHGPKVTFDTFVQSLKQSFNNKQDINQAIIFHLDISPSVRDVTVLVYLSFCVRC